MKDLREYTIWDAATPVAIVSTTDATPIVVRATAHGFTTGDKVMIYGHTTNVAANGIFKVTVLDANRFSLQHRLSGANIAGSGAGAGGAAGIVIIAPKVVPLFEFKTAVLNFITSGTATLTVKLAGSIGRLAADADEWGDDPNFGATVSKSNPYNFIQVINLDTGASVNGATGIAAAGIDLNNNYEVNTNFMKYFTLIPTAWTQGAITAKVHLADNT